jgi:hypothetical protein
MDIGLLKNLQALTARYKSGLTLNVGRPQFMSNKDYQNRLVSENIFRKAVQLVNDLEFFNRKSQTLSQPNKTAAPNSGRGSLFDSQS